MAVTDAELEKIFQDHLNASDTFLQDAQDAIATGFQTFQDPSAFEYTPYEWQTPSPPVIAYAPQFDKPSRPARPSLAEEPKLLDFPKEVANPTFTKPSAFTAQAPFITLPPAPSGEPSDNTGAAPQVSTPVFPNGPTLLALPSTALPYPFITIPNPPTLNLPVFDGVVPDDIHQISLQEYLDKLTGTYAQYSQDIPNLAKANWFAWFTAYLGQRPLIDKLATTISNYIDTGGAGIPVPIEEAIVTRSTDRVAVENRRATMGVYNDMAKRGLTLPSGALLSGLKEARQIEAEAVSKVATDVAIKNLELEHDHMKFMLQLGSELEKWVSNFASDCAKYVLEANGQAIEMTKLVLTGMIEINNTIVKIYLAKWEAYKAAVEVYKAKIDAVEAQIRIYEAEIRAELAKTEVNKATVEVLTAITNANRAIAEVYKVQVDAATARIEADRVRVMAYEATVRAYGARVEAWRAKWQGYTAQVEGEIAKTKVYESQVAGYTALVNAYRTDIEAYSALIHGQTERVQAVATINEAELKAWSLQVDALLRAYVADTEAYRAEWQAVGEQIKGYAEGARIVADSVFKGYEIEARIDTERAHEHLAEWRSHLEATLQAAQGMIQASSVAGNIAASAMNGITSFAGGLATTGA